MPQYRNSLLTSLALSLCFSLFVGCGPLPHRDYPGGRVDTANGTDTTASGSLPSEDTVSIGQNDRYHKLMSQYRAWQGVPHRDGGSDRRGIDCSAFVERTFDEQFNMNVPGTTAKLKNYGKPISRQDLVVGDLVMFKTGIVMKHVGIYLGNGKMLHVSSQNGVSISPINSGYWSDHYWQSRRVF